MAGPRDPEDTAAVRSGYHLWVLLLFLKARLPNHHSRVGDVWQELLKQLIKHTMFRWTVGETVESGCDTTGLEPSRARACAYGRELGLSAPVAVSGGVHRGCSKRGGGFIHFPERIKGPQGWCGQGRRTRPGNRQDPGRSTGEKAGAMGTFQKLKETGQGHTQGKWVPAQSSE